MVNVFLIVVVVILALVIFAGSVYIVVYFQHPEDKNVAWVPKIIVVLGLMLACMSVLMLPMDVANAHSGGDIDMATLWIVVYIVIAVLVVVVIPFAMFYYEADEIDEFGNEEPQLKPAIKGTLIILVIFTVITAVMYIFLGIAQIPVAVISGSFVTDSLPTKYIDYRTDNSSTSNETARTFDTVNYTDIITTTDANGTQHSYNLTYYNVNDVYETPSRYRTYIQFRVTIVLYIITMVVFFGWILFILFGGVGLVALPLDNINAFKNRPIRIPVEVYHKKKLEIGDRATKLLGIGRQLQDKMKKRGVGQSQRQRRRDRANYNKFRQAVFLLEEDYKRLQLCYKLQGGKIIMYYLQAFFGGISVGLTIAWLLHILLYMFTYPYPYTPFLNALVIVLDNALGLLGTVTYGIFAFYLLLCCVKGNFKFGLRLFFLFPIHPMRVGETLMNAFLFNTGLILICAVAVTQFCSDAFQDYTALTAINSLFSISVRNMMGIRYIFIGYIYALFIMTFLTAIYLFVKPKDKPAEIIL